MVNLLWAILRAILNCPFVVTLFMVILAIALCTFIVVGFVYASNWMFP